jgi:hypothetical protein
MVSTIKDLFTQELYNQLAKRVASLRSKIFGLKSHAFLNNFQHANMIRGHYTCRPLRIHTAMLCHCLFNQGGF